MQNFALHVVVNSAPGPGKSIKLLQHAWRTVSLQYPPGRRRAPNTADLQAKTAGTAASSVSKQSTHTHYTRVRRQTPALMQTGRVPDRQRMQTGYRAQQMGKLEYIQTIQPQTDTGSHETGTDGMAKSSGRANARMRDDQTEILPAQRRAALPHCTAVPSLSTTHFPCRSPDAVF